MPKKDQDLPLTRRNSSVASRAPVSPVQELFSGEADWREEQSRITWSPPVDVRETEESYVVTVELPGLSKDDVAITLDGNVLKLAGERRLERDAKEELHRIERSYGSFTRAFSMPSQVSSENIAAEFQSGLLTIMVPKTRPSRPQPIPIVESSLRSVPRVADLGTPLTARESQLLTEGGFDVRPRPAPKDPVAEAAAQYAELLGTSLSTSDAGARLGVDASRIRQRLAEKTLYGIRQRSGWVLPAFQFVEGGEVPGIGAVASRLRDELHPVAVQRWFTQPHVDLVDPQSGERFSPRDWLRAGFSTEVVARVAAGL